METKTCSRCKLEKEITEFTPHPTRGTQPYCRECNREYQREHYRINKQKYLDDRVIRNRKYKRDALKLIVEYSKTGCIKCGESDFRVLEFDHIDPATKEFDISDALAWGYGVSRIEPELKKCQVMCANCHRRKTFDQRGWHKENLDLIDIL